MRAAVRRHAHLHVPAVRRVECAAQHEHREPLAATPVRVDARQAAADLVERCAAAKTETDESAESKSAECARSATTPCG
jgi:hypothetical protein